MKIVVVGGSGLAGSRIVERLRADGHDAVAASRRSGVDTTTGDGLDTALAGAQVVVDASNAPVRGDDAVLRFFETSARNLLAAGAAAGVGHHVLLSIVGVDRVPGSPYYRAKVVQEEVVRAGGVPFTIVRSTQFFEFAGRIADASTDGDVVRLPPAFVQPVAVDDVAATLAELAAGGPANGIVELAGPERFRLDELVRRFLTATGDPRQVVTDPDARYSGAKLDADALLPGPGARIGPTRFEDWLARSRPA